MKNLLIILLLLSGYGCRELPVESEAPPVILKTDKREYLVQERITVTIENQSPDPILYYDCFEIDQLVEGQWAFVGYWWQCQSINYPVREGGHPTQGRPGLESEGEYRLAVDVLLQEDWRQRERVASERFIVKTEDEEGL